MALERMSPGAQLRWDDMKIPVGSMILTGGNQPAVGVFLGAVATLLFAPSVLNEVHFTVQLTHRYAEGSDIEPHVHWAPATTNTGNVRWGLEYAWENVNGVFTATNTVFITQAGAGVAGTHQVIGFGPLTGTGKLLSSMLACRLFRDGGNAADTFTGNAALLEWDTHVQMDTGRGSRQQFVK